MEILKTIAITVIFLLVILAPFYLGLELAKGLFDRSHPPIFWLCVGMVLNMLVASLMENLDK